MSGSLKVFVKHTPQDCSASSPSSLKSDTWTSECRVAVQEDLSGKKPGPLARSVLVSTSTCVLLLCAVDFFPSLAF